MSEGQENIPPPTRLPRLQTPTKGLSALGKSAAAGDKRKYLSSPIAPPAKRVVSGPSAGVSDVKAPQRGATSFAPAPKARPPIARPETRASTRSTVTAPTRSSALAARPASVSSSTSSSASSAATARSTKPPAPGTRRPISAAGPSRLAPGRRPVGAGAASRQTKAHDHVTLETVNDLMEAEWVKAPASQD
ncbi:hypothetical protein Q8F55_007055 [Vanrija albida]|uniref:Uncharacterized protein n=1 Tax=Vanrija albida TaxID=181172 RepID=A0ABR3PZ35_9TREE